MKYKILISITFIVALVISTGCTINVNLNEEELGVLNIKHQAEDQEDVNDSAEDETVEDQEVQEGFNYDNLIAKYLGGAHYSSWLLVAINGDIETYEIGEDFPHSDNNVPYKTLYFRDDGYFVQHNKYTLKSGGLVGRWAIDKDQNILRIDFDNGMSPQYIVKSLSEEKLVLIKKAQLIGTERTTLKTLMYDMEFTVPEGFKYYFHDNSEMGEIVGEGKYEGYRFYINSDYSPGEDPNATVDKYEIKSNYGEVFYVTQSHSDSSVLSYISDTDVGYVPGGKFHFSVIYRPENKEENKEILDNFIKELIVSKK